MTVSQWRFESFCLDPVNACLWWGAETVILTPKAFDVLHYLVRHADRLVTKDLKGARDLCRSLNLMKKQGVVGSTRP
jgi:hypothetical protein